MSRKKAVPVVRTPFGLREILFDEIEALQRGKSTPTQTNAISAMAKNINDTYNVEIAVYRLMHQGGALSQIDPLGSLLPHQPASESKKVARRS